MKLENQLETLKGKLCQVVTRSKCYDKHKRKCNSVQESMKKINHEKEFNIRTDHQCKVENVKQCRQVPQQEKVRECNFVNNPVCNGICGDEVPLIQCNDAFKKML